MVKDSGKIDTMARFRFTLRGMMLVVIFAALPLAALAVIGRRRATFDRLAFHHRRQIIGLSRGPGDKPLSEAVVRKDAWHSRLFEKYIQAAISPWLPVEADPPEPK